MRSRLDLSGDGTCRLGRPAATAAHKVEREEHGGGDEKGPKMRHANDQPPIP